MHENWYSRQDNIVTVSIYVQPNAKNNVVVGLYGDALKIKLATPPIEGRANEALIKFLAQIFEIPKSSIRLTRGHTSRHKVLQIYGSQVDPQSLITCT